MFTNYTVFSFIDSLNEIAQQNMSTFCPTVECADAPFWQFTLVVFDSQEIPNKQQPNTDQITDKRLFIDSWSMQD